MIVIIKILYYSIYSSELAISYYFSLPPKCRLGFFFGWHPQWRIDHCAIIIRAYASCSIIATCFCGWKRWRFNILSECTEKANEDIAIIGNSSTCIGFRWRRLLELVFWSLVFMCILIAAIVEWMIYVITEFAQLFLIDEMCAIEGHPRFQTPPLRRQTLFNCSYIQIHVAFLRSNASHRLFSLRTKFASNILFQHPPASLSISIRHLSSISDLNEENKSKLANKATHPSPYTTLRAKLVSFAHRMVNIVLCVVQVNTWECAKRIRSQLRRLGRW